MESRAFTKLLKRILIRALGLALWVSFSSCSRPAYESQLPSAAELGNPRGYRIARVITHLHSPYSHDACDYAGMTNGVLNAQCLEHLQDALCSCSIDMAFLSDHPDNQSNYPIQDLVVAGKRGNLLKRESAAYASQIPKCTRTAVSPILMAGFESKVMALGMTKHLSNPVSELNALYSSQSRALRQQLQEETEALVVIPHTESRTLEEIKEIGPDAIEIYNIHANLDPKIRKQYLGQPTFSTLANIFSYIIDPYNSLKPDFIFMGFFEWSSVYATKWNALLASGTKMPGLTGSDAHENFLSAKLADGERIDSYRRLLRFASNHVLVNTLNPENVKAALKSGHSWVVFEGFGTPVQMDFWASSGGQTVGTGDTLKLDTQAMIGVEIPSLHSMTSKGSETPTIEARLLRINSDGSAELVGKKATSGRLEYLAQAPGIYRTEIYITPKHLREFLDVFSDKADQVFPWIITNPIYIE